MGLSPYYPRPLKIALLQPMVVVSLIGVMVITALCLWRGRRTPLLVTGWGTYVLFILPVSGLTPTGGQAVADRYAYLAMLPLLVLAGGAAGVVVEALSDDWAMRAGLFVGGPQLSSSE